MRTLIGSFCLCLVAAILPTGPASADTGSAWRWHCDEQPVVDFWGEEIEGNTIRGRGLFCATPFGLWSTLRTKDLTPGNAYTVWWVYIDNPAACAAMPLPSPDAIPFPEPTSYAGPCGLADFFTPQPGTDILDPLAVFGRMDSVIAKYRRITRFSGNVKDFTPSSGSQVWLFVFGHGPADHSDKRQLARQLLTPEDPGSGAPHLGIEGRLFGYPAAVVVFELP